MVDAFDAVDEPVLHARDLAGLAADAWPDVRLRPVRSLVLLSSLFPVDHVRERLLGGEDDADTRPGRVQLRIWRQEWTVYHRRMDECEAAALDWLRGGATFAELCEWLSERDGDDQAAASALRLLHRWLDDELLAA
jgi:hypothetical protein